MHLHDFSNFAVIGSTVNGLTMSNVVIDGTNGDNETINEDAVRVDNLTGSASVSNSAIQGGRRDNFRVIDTGGTLNRIVFDTVTFGQTDTTVGDDSLFIQAREDAVINATVQNSNLTYARGDQFQFDQTDICDGKHPSGDLILTNNQIVNTAPVNSLGGGGVTISGGGCATSNVSLTYGITGNTFKGAMGDALLLALQTGQGSFNGTISGNSFGAQATDKSGSNAASNIEVRTVGRGSQTVNIANNNIFQYHDFGILLQTGNINSGGSTGTVGSLQATVTGNTISTPNSAHSGASNGFQLNSGTNAGDTFSNCLDLKNNTATGSGNGTIDIQLRQRQLTTVSLPGYAGANNDNTAVRNFITTTNLNTGLVTVSNTVSTGGGGYVGGAQCTPAAVAALRDVPGADGAA